MTDQIILNADVRERTGSNKARVIRKIDGMVPAIVYGDEKETINIKLIQRNKFLIPFFKFLEYPVNQIIKGNKK